jgi:hypothetical protein
MNKIIFPLSIVMAASLGYWAGKNSNTSHTPVSPSIVTEREAVTASTTTKTSSAFSEVQHQQRDTVAAAKQQLLDPEQSNSGQPSQQQIDAIKAQYEAGQRSEKFTDWLTKNQKDKPWFDLGVEMNGRFAAEETDYSWAAAEEEYLQTLFVQEPALAGIALKSTSCKSTQCQIKVSVIDQDHANETAMAISKVISSNKSTQIIIDNKATQGEAIFYVSRNEKGFELK